MLCGDNDDEIRARWDCKSGSRGKARSKNGIDSNGLCVTRGGVVNRLDMINKIIHVIYTHPGLPVPLVGEAPSRRHKCLMSLLIV